MWKKLALMLLVLALISVFTIPSAEAESRHRRVLKALVLGGLLAALPPPPVVIAPVPERHYRPPREEYVPGHWEMTREWVPGTWERVWIPGYYDRWGNWVAGHYENRQAPGYYEERRVWVEGHYRPY
jgi:hypothetical protein